jgi:uncharacterized protein (UPF0335 family)
VARTRNPNRDEAKKQWLESGGKISTKELAAAAGVPEGRIRKWKSEDKWQEELNAKKPGGQRGNRNAAGHGAPKGNSNAETHGAYSRVHLEDLTPEERAYIESLTLDTESAMLRELQLLMAKEQDLRRKIKGYEQAHPDALYIDRVVEMLVPRGNERLQNSQKKLEEMLIERDNLAWEVDANPRPSKTSVNRLEKLDAEIAALQDKVSDRQRDYEDKGALKTTMQTVIKSSPFERAMKLEAEYNKLHGRILKLIDTMRAHGIDVKRLDLDERKHTLTKQRLMGEYDIDPDTGEIQDTENTEDAEDLGIDV